MKILFITYYWPPCGGVSAQRILHFAKNLNEFGHECHVIAPKNAAYYTVDESLNALVSEQVHVHPVPINDITRLVKKFKSTSNTDNVKKVSGSAFGNFIKKVRANWFIPDPKVNWVNPVVKKAFALLSNQKFDLIFTNGTPHSVHLSGLAIKQKINIPWIADFRDPWTKLDYFDHLPYSKEAIKKHKHLEQLVIKNADLVLTVSSEWAADFNQLGAQKSAAITNGFETKIDRLPNNDFLVSHVGTLHSDRNIDAVLKSIKDLTTKDGKRIQLVLAGSVSDFVFENCTSILSKDQLILPGIVSHAEAKNWIAQSSILLLPINDSVASKGRIPAKLFEYLSSEIPILLTGNKDGDAAKILHETNAGMSFNSDDHSGISSYINKIYTAEYKISPNTKAIAQYHRTELSRNLEHFMIEMTGNITS